MPVVRDYGPLGERALPPAYNLIKCCQYPMLPFPKPNSNWNWQHWNWQHFHIGNILNPHNLLNLLNPHFPNR